jgi:predicted RNase H-like nuclease (RuvC/YqgF family)
MKYKQIKTKEKMNPMIRTKVDNAMENISKINYKLSRMIVIEKENQDLKREIEILKDKIFEFEQLLYQRDEECIILEERMKLLEDHIRYSPDGEGFIESEEHFNSIVKMINK